MGERTMRTIKCQICGKEVEVTSSRQKYCPECKKAAELARKKEYYKDNKEKICKQKKEYYENNKEHILEQQKEYHENNKEHLKEYQKNYSKEWRDNNYIHADREGNDFCVYIHTDPIGKVYIGRAVGDDVKTVNRQRWQGGSGYKTQKFYDECIAVYGWNNIQHELLEWGLTYEEVIEREQYWIERYNSRNPEYGYNVM